MNMYDLVREFPNCNILAGAGMGCMFIQIRDGKHQVKIRKSIANKTIEPYLVDTGMELTSRQKTILACMLSDFFVYYNKYKRGLHGIQQFNSNSIN